MPRFRHNRGCNSETERSTAPLRLIFSSLAGCRLGRIVKEELIAVGIIDHQEPVAPRTFLDWSALGLEFRAQRVQRSDRRLARLRLDVQRNEDQPLANLR